MTSTSPLLPPTFLFRFAAACPYKKSLWDNEKGADLPAGCRLPNFGVMEDRPSFAEVRAGWNEDGIAFSVTVQGKKQAPWCRKSKPDESDGLHVWIDTRATRDIHRASRFCHYFSLLPAGGGRDQRRPIADLLPIHRAKESPRPIIGGMIQVMASLREEGYSLSAYVPAVAMTGYDPADYPQLGFYYAVIDRELGWQTLSLGPEFPVTESPSLWGTLDLARAK